MVPMQEVYGFTAEYRGGSAAFDEFEKYLRIEFAKRQPGWQPSFGRLTWRDPKLQGWNYEFLIRGSVPEAATRADAEEKVHRLVRELGAGMRAAHANPGSELPEPVITVWQWPVGVAS